MHPALSPILAEMRIEMLRARPPLTASFAQQHVVQKRSARGRRARHSAAFAQEGTAHASSAEAGTAKSDEQAPRGHELLSEETPISQ
jgi:hypothetical protein